MQKNNTPLTSRIVTKNGAQYIEANGELIDGLAYITYLRDNNRYEDFAKAGYRLFSTVVFFGKNKLNENSGLDFFSEGIFDGEVPNFSGFDRDIENILSFCPTAYIFPRVNTSPSEMWEAEHPDELCLMGSSIAPERKRACLASDLYAKEVKKNLARFIEHIENSDYRDHIIGYQLVGGNTEEWIPYDGSAFEHTFTSRRTAFIGKRSLEKYEKHLESTRRPDTDEEFYNFHADIVCDRVLEFSRFVKEKTDRRLIVGAFYGYTFELCRKNGMHQRLARVLESPDVDFICSPVSYGYTRPMGIEHAYMVPIDTLRLHGKLYFSENDTRTHLSKPLNDIPSYNLPIWFGHPKEDTLEILKMHYSRALINGHAAWWFDMWGGWYEDEDYMAFMKRAMEISKSSRETSRRSLAELAVFVDENSFAKVSENTEVGKVVYNPRREIGLIGAPYDMYLASDFELVKDNYKAYITLSPAPTELYSRISDYARGHGIAHYEINRENAESSLADVLRKFARDAGVHIYSALPAVVYACESYVFIHTGEGGEQTFDIPGTEEPICEFTGEKLKKRFYAPLGKSFLIKR